MGDKLNLIYKLNGPRIEDGIDVFELSPMLLSMGKLVQEAHKTLYPDSQEIAVNIRPFQRGSFEIDFVLFGKTAVQQVLTFFHSTKGQEIRDVLACIGLIAGPPGLFASLITIILFLRGRLKKAERLQSGEVRYMSEDNRTITVHNNIHLLFQNPNIQDALYNGLARPLETEGIDSFESHLKAHQETKVTYGEEIVEPIKNYHQSSVVGPEDETVIENMRQLWVHPKRGSFEGEKHSWSFRVCGTNNIMTANILDTAFLENVKAGRIRLAQVDRLLIEINERQQIGRGEIIRTIIDVTKVKEYVKTTVPTQSTLLDK